MRLALVAAVAAVLVVPVGGFGPVDECRSRSCSAPTSSRPRGRWHCFRSGEIKTLMNEGKASGEAARSQRLAAVKAGKKPRYCPPEGPQKMDSDEFMNRLAAIPRGGASADQHDRSMTRNPDRQISLPLEHANAPPIANTTIMKHGRTMQAKVTSRNVRNSALSRPSSIGPAQLPVHVDWGMKNNRKARSARSSRPTPAARRR